jgi:protein phosphatase
MTRFAARTHAGYSGDANEDAFGGSDTHGMWFIADGMGGHAAGQVASDIVRKTLLDALADSNLSATIRKAHAAVIAAAESNEEWRGMGSTVVAARIERGICLVAWVGDSRAYLWRRNELRALTRDHSLLEALRDEGVFSDTQLRGQPNAHLITQSIGAGNPTPSTSETPLRRGDRILLCSDGLHDELSEPEICAALGSHREPAQAAEALINGALMKGGHDNVTALVVEYDGPSVAPAEVSRQSLVLFSILSGVAAAALAAGIWWYFGRG